MSVRVMVDVVPVRTRRAQGSALESARDDSTPLRRREGPDASPLEKKQTRKQGFTT